MINIQGRCAFIATMTRGKREQKGNRLYKEHQLSNASLNGFKMREANM
jgi:hypothetical protein